jgi:hypothetical protein
MVTHANNAREGYPLNSTPDHFGLGWDFVVCFVLYTLELISFNSKELGREFLTKPSMFAKLEVHAEVVWRFEPITFYIGELRVKLI